MGILIVVAVDNVGVVLKPFDRASAGYEEQAGRLRKAFGQPKTGFKSASCTGARSTPLSRVRGASAPQPIGFGASDSSNGQIRCRLRASDLARTRPDRIASEAKTTTHEFNRAVREADDWSAQKLGTLATHVSRPLVNLTDHLGGSPITHRSRERRAFPPHLAPGHGRHDRIGPS